MRSIFHAHLAGEGFPGGSPGFTATDTDTARAAVRGGGAGRVRPLTSLRKK